MLFLWMCASLLTLLQKRAVIGKNCITKFGEGLQCSFCIVSESAYYVGLPLSELNFLPIS